MPLVFAIKIRNKPLAICLGVIWVWGLLVVSIHFKLASSLEQFSPTLAMLGGWLPGLICAFCMVLVVAVGSHIFEFFRSRNQ